MYDNLQTFMRNTWEGIDTADIQVIINQADHEDLVEANDFLQAFPEYQLGIPFKGDNPIWDRLLETDNGAVALQNIVDEFD